MQRAVQERQLRHRHPTAFSGFVVPHLLFHRGKELPAHCHYGLHIHIRACSCSSARCWNVVALQPHCMLATGPYQTTQAGTIRLRAVNTSDARSIQGTSWGCQAGSGAHREHHARLVLHHGVGHVHRLHLLLHAAALPGQNGLITPAPAACAADAATAGNNGGADLQALVSPRSTESGNISCHVARSAQSWRMPATGQKLQSRPPVPTFRHEHTLG